MEHGDFQTQTSDLWVPPELYVAKLKKKGSFPWHTSNTVQICYWVMESVLEYFMFTSIIVIHWKSVKKY